MRRPLRPLPVGIGLLLLLSVPARAQVVTGTVTDAETGQPLVGVNVIAERTPEGVLGGAVTGTDGRYRIVLPAGVDSLTFSYLGYARQRVAVAGRAVVDVALVPVVGVLGDVVVTALGIERQERELGYAVQRIGPEDLAPTDAGNLVASLSGRVAGAQVVNTGGAPGQGVRIILRGLTSLERGADNQPLFVVDGIPIDNSTNVGAEGFDSRGFSNRAVDLNPNDIESITVLKGASATALYGLRAANGAIVITTRRGAVGAPRVTVSSSVSAETVNRFPEVQQVYTQGFGGVYDPTSFWCCWGAHVDEARTIDPDVRFFHNYRRAYQTGYAADLNVSLTGGTEQATFYASLGRYAHSGVLPFSDWARTSVRLSGALRPFRRASFEGALNYVNSGGHRVFADRFNERLVYWSPNRDVRDYMFENGTMKGYYGTGPTRSNQGTNPLYDARFAPYRDDVHRLIGSLQVGYDLADGVRLLYRVGADTYTDARFQTMRGPLGFDGENVLSPNGHVGETRIFSRDLTSTLNLTVFRPLSRRLSAELLLGHDVFDRYGDQVFTFGQGLTIPDLYRFSNVREIQTSLSTRHRRLVGVYGSLKLGFDDALYVEATGRNDWSSTLPRANRSFFYPSLNLSYVFTEHLNPGGALDLGRLRLSVAEVGKDTEPYRLSRTFTAPAAFPLAGQTGFALAPTLGSPDLRPERTVSTEAGLDLRFLQGRLRVDGTYYRALSKDQIIPVPVSNTTGFATVVLNAGSIRNEGVELAVGGDVVRSRTVDWEVTLNFARNRNTVVSIREGVDEILIGSQFGYVGATATLRLVPGAPYGAIYGRSYARYYGPDGEPPTDGPRVLRRDLPLLIGANGFPVIDPTPRILGNMTPDWIGGLLNRVRVGAFELAALVDVSMGGQKYNQWDNFFSSFGIATYTLNRNETVVFEGVRADGSPNTQPVWLGQGVGPDGRNYGAGFYRNVYRAATENSVMDASFVKLRNASLAYTLPSRLVARAGVARARVRLSASNIILWTPYAYWDPEVTTSGTGNEQGFSGLAHPGVSTYTLTLDLGL